MRKPPVVAPHLLIGFRKEDDKAPAHVTVRLDRGDDPSVDGPSAERFEIRQQRLPHRGVVDTLSSNLLDVADAEEVCELFVAPSARRDANEIQFAELFLVIGPASSWMVKGMV